jgi:hypothetical protein
VLVYLVSFSGDVSLYEFCEFGGVVALQR